MCIRDRRLEVLDRARLVVEGALGVEDRVGARVVVVHGRDDRLAHSRVNLLHVGPVGHRVGAAPVSYTHLFWQFFPKFLLRDKCEKSCRNPWIFIVPQDMSAKDRHHTFQYRNPGKDCPTLRMTVG